MSSGFVPAGTILPDTPLVSNPEDAAWAAARAAVSGSSSSSTAGAGASTSVSATDPSDTRSLFEILQANKTRKQEEFAEKLKFKNQFRALDEDDVEFLDSVMDGQKRLDEERRRKEREEVEKFKELQSAGDAGVGVEAELKEEEEEVKWGKRKRGEKRGRPTVTALAGVKVKRKEETEEGATKKDRIDGGGEEKTLEAKKRKVEEKVETKQTTVVEKPAEKATAPVPKVGLPKVALGLDYGSDSDDD
ncbi:N-terminal domain of NEFA-interacting nuclear protein NIP30-domain-containing protein [Tricharina praecox]|uniref:N-terminal domain of NEFA-interacting nuclear protein NIP30-domain-containing protein n=1 Tax=Tricharina praecox TaxID=43433 RepID=UPI00221F9709|nr:N-terminal domain of NEFA-interacting nuclear protein NIP30-domain-containing protein [Tricharina praecox]KAI5855725.1 N-terminal domain of NEFA-interacting nuclear protein NIP30-domain-containing protein [Tricharina praecox]